MAKVNYVGLGVLDKTDQERLKKLVSKYYSRLSRKFSVGDLKFHTKTADVSGRTRYRFQARIIHGKDVLNAESEVWTLRKGIHLVMRKLITAVEHKFHLEGQKQQKFHPKRGKGNFGKSVKLKLRGLVKFI